MRAILTSYLGPTNTRGACMVAKDTVSQAPRVTLPYDYCSSGMGRDTDQHRAVLVKLVDRLGWGGLYQYGYTHGGLTWVDTRQQPLTRADGTLTVNLNDLDVATIRHLQPIDFEVVDDALNQGRPYPEVLETLRQVAATNLLIGANTGREEAPTEYP